MYGGDHVNESSGVYPLLFHIDCYKARDGYLFNTKWRGDFQIRDDGDIVDITKDEKISQSDEKSGWFKVTGGSETNQAKVPDDIKRADIQFAKYDIDGRKMAGIPFMISRCYTADSEKETA